VKRRGHPVIGAISGFFLVLGLDLVLITTGTLSIADKIPLALPILGLILGGVWGFFGPLGKPKSEY
jgi:hypothetical protein